MTEPLRLLAIDPALVATGVAVVNVTGFGQVDVESQFTIETSAKDSLAGRVAGICNGVTAPALISDYAVIEEPNMHWAGGGRRTSPQAIFMKAVGYGAALAGLRAHGENWDRVELVGVSRWYPRTDLGHPMKKPQVVKMIRAQFPEADLTEHTCMALGLALWWSRKVAPLVWAGTVPRETVSPA